MEILGLLAPLLGLILGSFLNVCIHRLPQEQSLWRPGSHCPKCGHPVAFYDNIPVLSFLWLGGRCRHCGSRISARYPAVELLTAALFSLLYWRWQGRPEWALASWLAAGILIAVAFIDWDTFLIPDILSYGLLASGLLLSPINPLLGEGPWWRLGQSAAGAALGFALCWGTAELGEAAFKKEAMGGGDIKLLAGVGAWSGALGAFDCLVVASLLGSVYGGALLLRGSLRREDPIPFGPFLSAAAILNFFWLMPFGFPFLGAGGGQG